MANEYLKDKYQTEKIVYIKRENVLGEEITLQEEFPDKFAEMTKNYGIDEYINNWDGKLEGYYKQVAYISSPEHYLSLENSKFSEQWELKEGYKVSGRDKRARLDSITYMIRHGRVFFPREGAEDLIQQLVYFGVEKHDDLVDAFTMVLHVSLEVKYYDIQIFNKELLGL